METIHEEYENNNPHLYDVVNTSDEEEDDEDSSEEYSSNTDSEECCGEKRILGLSSKMSWLREWDRVFPLISALCLFIDPTFFYTLSLNGDGMCFFIDGWFALGLSLIRLITDGLHVRNIWHVYFRKDHRHSSSSAYWFHRIYGGLALHNIKGKLDFFIYVFAILPLPQVVIWIVVPALLKMDEQTRVMTVMLILFLFQYLPKIYIAVCLLRRMLFQYIFGTAWWGIGLNIVAIFVASHVVGACYYLLGIQRSARCLMEQCMKTESCRLDALSCSNPFFFGSTYKVTDNMRMSWGNNNDARSWCLESSNNSRYYYGSFQWITLLICNSNRMEKMLLPLFWGIMMLCTFGNLVSTDDWLEIVFLIIVIACGLVLVTMLIGNIKVFLIATSSNKHTRKVNINNLDWWMKRRNMPQGLRNRIRNYERQRWIAMRGVDELDMISNLPEGLRRDIKYHLCLDLVRQVPLFQHMDSMVLESICDRVKSLVFPQGEIITKEGDPVQRMLFIVRGHLQCNQTVRSGIRSCCMLGPGNFIGDELLAWCVRKPFIEILPPSSSTLITLEATEAFGLEAEDVKYVTQHFRLNEKVKMCARYYSPGWRTWAAVTIQLAWLRCRHRRTLASLPFLMPRRPLSRSASFEEERLRLYTALLTSPKPHQDDMLPRSDN
ncbi:Cyclic nucleotide-binding domain-containing protein [Heracleum sosnowskyi]|uniref:Cyclic nucleotide-binding domain-containing protein n=1 Tax=Heracleum sosnowskyi TaxID=360622 RepID=A0AAD8N0Q2_9APIA|nr:Cyclic nucleotide-binding domain-containing protein [Heracleum sosnowskyi]